MAKFTFKFQKVNHLPDIYMAQFGEEIPAKSGEMIFLFNNPADFRDYLNTKYQGRLLQVERTLMAWDIHKSK